MADWFERTGIILFVENYEACIAFYRDALELPIEEEKPGLVRFGFGAAYLMVERGGVAHGEGKSREQSPATLRFNVTDIDAVAVRLRARGIAPDIRHWALGTTAHFLDPDGNRVEVRDPFHPVADLRSAAKSPI